MKNNGRDGLIIMTACPPTEGHKFLVEFAYNFLKANDPNSILDVLINIRPGVEPANHIRVSSLSIDILSYFEDAYLNICDDPTVPQNPEDHPDFWVYWRDLIRKHTSNKPGDFLFASEKYGKPLADVLECEFIPVDIKRGTIEISATRIRNQPIDNFGLMLPVIRRALKKTVTTFGPESCGKTTMAKALSRLLPGYFAPEWARGYLEEVGPEVTPEKMDRIVKGQFALQKNLLGKFDKPFVFQDTDLFSTLGYYRLWQGSEPPGLAVLAYENRSDLYLVMNDQIPFTPDILRYGGDKRESQNQFWIDLLEEFDLNYHIVEKTQTTDQFSECVGVCIEYFNQCCPFYRYERD